MVAAGSVGVAAASVPVQAGTEMPGTRQVALAALHSTKTREGQASWQAATAAERAEEGLEAPVALAVPVVLAASVRVRPVPLLTRLARHLAESGSKPPYLVPRPHARASTMAATVRRLMSLLTCSHAGGQRHRCWARTWRMDVEPGAGQ